MQDVEFLMPCSLEQALKLLSSYAPTAKLVAGGTDYVASLNSGAAKISKCLIGLGRVDELKGIKRDGNNLIIGALATHSEIAASAIVKDLAPNLYQAASLLGTPAIRNMGTLGGNLVNASSAADTAVTLLAADAQVQLISQTGMRNVKLTDFFVENGETILQTTEILGAVEIPAESSKKCFYTRIAANKGNSIPLVNLAVEVIEEQGVCRTIRVAMGSVASVPLRLLKVEEVLNGQVLNDENLKKAAEIAAQEINPRDDTHASAWYRRQVSKNIFPRTVLAVLNNSNTLGTYLNLN